MNLLSAINRLWAHSAWADRLVFDALSKSTDTGTAWREYAHILGAEETWLARLEGRAPRAAIWPVLEPAETAELRAEIVVGYETYLSTLDDAALGTAVEYTNSAGQTFQTACGDILIHVALHGQYHRGKINLLLRQAGADPAPADYIGYVRGTPAAVRPDRS